MNSAPETRYSLIGKLRNPQDIDAWTEFASIYQPLIMRIACKRGLQHADAVDVTQEVLTRVAAAIDRFDAQKPGVNFRGWLYRITRNLVIDFLRNRERSPAVQVREETEFSQAAAPCRDESAEFQLEFQRQIFWQSAREVRSQVLTSTWHAFWMTEMQHRPVAEVAQELGLTTGAVYVARSRILARLRKVSEMRLAQATAGCEFPPVRDDLESSSHDIEVPSSIRREIQ